MRGKVTENWRKLHHKGISHVHYLPNTRCDQKVPRLGEWKLQFIANG